MGDKEGLRCLNPWFGLMVIIIICLIMTCAIFFQTRPERMKNRPRQRHEVTGVTQKLELPQGDMDRIIF